MLKKKDAVFINEEGTEEKKDIYIIATWGARGKVPRKRNNFAGFEGTLISAVRASIYNSSNISTPTNINSPSAP